MSDIEPRIAGATPFLPQQWDWELTILMPCLNEAETLGTCIDKARGFLERHRVAGEVLIADNGSTDGSQQIAAQHAARVIHVEEKGYGSALFGGIAAARGRYVIMGDADDSYDFTDLMPFLSALREGYQLVMGNRFLGGIRPGAMPSLHRYLGNPVLTGVGRLLFNSKSGDFHCGLRGFDKQAIEGLNLQTAGMEFASEMVVKATLQRLRITEVPTTLSPDGRTRPPHLRSWRDGWRHLRFLLLFSPRWLFFYPGILLILIGLGSMAWLLPGPHRIGGVTLDIHTMLYSSLAIILGVQVVSFALFAKVYGVNAGFLLENERMTAVLAGYTLERGLLLGLGLFGLGLAGSVYAVYAWGTGSFGDLMPSAMMRLIIPAATALAVGVQLMFGSFFLSVLKIPARYGYSTPPAS
jgi:glycosyltransferase involved in cell wall biosynthesis